MLAENIIPFRSANMLKFRNCVPQDSQAASVHTTIALQRGVWECDGENWETAGDVEKLLPRKQ